MSRRFVYYGAGRSSVTLLLDDYPAVVAYSLRKLRTAYTGSAIRVRRSSDNTEQDIGFVGNSLDTASLLSFVGANNGFVTTWYDQQSSNDLIQATSTRQPQIVSSGSLILRGGEPSVKFDGSNDRMIYNSSVMNSGARNTSYFSVSNNDNSSSIGTILSLSTASTNSLRTFNERSAIRRRSMIIGASGTSTEVEMSTFRTGSDPILHSNFVDGSNNMSTFDNSNTGTTNTYGGTTGTTAFQIGAQATGFTYLNGTIQEIVAYNTLELTNRTAIETNINDHYAIY